MKKIKLLFICCIVFLLTGCIDSELGDENVDKANQVQNLLNYKQDVYCEWGKESAFYKNRIYYFQDGEEPGIYSMDTRGKGRRLEVSVSNIRKLQVREDGIYYAGMIEGIYPTRYTLYRKEWDVPEPQEYLDPYPRQMYGDRNTWDFYINENNTMVVVDAYDEIPHMNLTFRAFMVDEQKNPVTLSEYYDCLENYDPGDIDYVDTSLFGYDNLLIMTKTGLESRKDRRDHDPEKDYGIHMDESNMTIFHEENNELLFFRTNAVYNENGVDSVLQTIYEDYFVIANGNQLQWVNTGNGRMFQKAELPEAVAVRYSIRDEEELLVVAEGEKTEYIYRISLDTAEIKTTYTVPKKQKVLAVSGNMLYTVSEKALYVYEGQNDGYEEQKCINWQNKLKKTSKLEMSGNVVFVYDVDSEKSEFTLIEYQVLDVKKK